MRPSLLACLLLLLLAAASAPRSAAVCTPRKPGAAGKPGRPVGPVPGSPKPPPPKSPKPALPAPPKAKPTPTPSPIAPGGDIVKTLCAKTDYPDLCQSSIAKQPQPPAGTKLDAAGVLRLAMGAVRAKAAEAKKAAEAFTADAKTPKVAMAALHDCIESFDGDIPYSLDQAEKAMASGDKGTMGTMLDAVRTDVDTCDNGFEERPELPQLMAKHDAELAKLASNCLAIADAAGLR